MKITNNFTIKEFIVSQDFPRIADEIKLTPWEESFITILANSILQPARNHINKPIQILSGKRSPQLNGLVGGSKTSDHLKAMAVDFVVLFKDGMTIDPNNTNIVFEYIARSMPNSFGQLILYVKDGGTPRFCHVSLPTIGHQGECWVFRPDGRERLT